MRKLILAAFAAALAIGSAEPVAAQAPPFQADYERFEAYQCLFGRTVAQWMKATGLDVVEPLDGWEGLLPLQFKSNDGQEMALGFAQPDQGACIVAATAWETHGMLGEGAPLVDYPMPSRSLCFDAANVGPWMDRYNLSPVFESRDYGGGFRLIMWRGPGGVAYGRLRPDGGACVLMVKVDGFPNRAIERLFWGVQ